MRTSILLTAIAVMAIAVPVYATVIPNPTPHAGELSVYEVYNTLYGTAFGSNAALDTMRIEDLQTFLIPDGENLTVEAEARYATVTSDFGYYAPAGIADNYNVLFTVAEEGFVSGNPAYTQTLDLSDEFGFFLDPLGEGAIWHSEQSLNFLSQDHMVAYSVDGQPDTILLAWEDIRPPDGFEGEEYQYMLQNEELVAPSLNADADYNDLFVELRFGVIPEPSTIILLGLGIAGMGVNRVRRKFSA